VNRAELMRLTWRTSSRSNGQANCVEVADLPDGGRAVRDSKDHGQGPVLLFTQSEWRAFTGGVKDGEFD
jgi:Domain of unknown function (DUF397)